MQDMFSHIEKRQREFANHPFFAFVADTSIPPAERFKFAPYCAPFILGAQDVFKLIMPYENPQDPLQQIVNQHCLEERGHAELYIADLRSLGKNKNDEYTNSLELLWGTKTTHTRQLLLEFASISSRADAKLRILLLESLEATQRVSFKGWREAAIAFQESTHLELHYFIGDHEKLEEDHDLYQADTRFRLLSTLAHPEEKKANQIAIDRIFFLFSSMFTEWLTNSLSHSR